MGQRYKTTYNEIYTETEFDDLLSALIIEDLPSAPTAIEGKIYRNSTDSKIYVYYSGMWQVIHAV